MTFGDIVIRAATEADAQKLSSFAADAFSRTFGHLYDPAELQKHLHETRSAQAFRRYLNQDEILLAVNGAELVGYIKYGPVSLPIECEATAIEIHHLYVSHTAQGRGIGRTIMDAVLAKPSLLSAAAIYLGVWENNLRARAFYESYGFEKVGEYTYYVGHHADREHILRRKQAGKTG